MHISSFLYNLCNGEGGQLSKLYIKTRCLQKYPYFLQTYPTALGVLHKVTASVSGGGRERSKLYTLYQVRRIAGVSIHIYRPCS